MFVHETLLTGKNMGVPWVVIVTSESDTDSLARWPWCSNSPSASSKTWSPKRTSINPSIIINAIKIIKDPEVQDQIWKCDILGSGVTRSEAAGQPVVQGFFLGGDWLLMHSFQQHIADCQMGGPGLGTGFCRGSTCPPVVTPLASGHLCLKPNSYCKQSNL